MSVYKFIAVSPLRSDRYNLWNLVVAFEAIQDCESLEEATSKFLVNQDHLKPFEIYHNASGFNRDSPLERPNRTTLATTRSEFRTWLDDEKDHVNLIWSSPDSFKFWDERRMSESHLEKRVIDVRPVIHETFDLLDAYHGSSSMRSVVCSATKEQRDILSATLNKRLPLMTKHILDGSIDDFRNLVLRLQDHE